MAFALLLYLYIAIIAHTVNKKRKKKNKKVSCGTKPLTTGTAKTIRTIVLVLNYWEASGGSSNWVPGVYN